MLNDDLSQDFLFICWDWPRMNANVVDRTFATFTHYTVFYVLRMYICPPAVLYVLIHQIDMPNVDERVFSTEAWLAKGQIKTEIRTVTCFNFEKKMRETNHMFSSVKIEMYFYLMVRIFPRMS